MEEISIVKKSYGRACLNPQFFDRFYDIFLKSSPKIEPKFAKTDFEKQKQLLRTGVAMLLSHVEGKSVGTVTLNRLGKSHSKKNLDIHPNLYQLWIDSLVKAIQECDPKCTPELERGWQKVCSVGVDYIAAQYDS